MNKRLCKKRAKAFYEGRYNTLQIRTEECQEYTDGRPPVYITKAVLSGKVEKVVIDMAYRDGWDGCHWDDPTILFIDDRELVEWEERNE